MSEKSSVVWEQVSSKPSGKVSIEEMWDERPPSGGHTSVRAPKVFRAAVDGGWLYLVCHGTKAQAVTFVPGR